METVNRLVLTFLLNALWQIALVACIAALSSRLMKKAPAAYRHWIWVMALGVSVLLPLESVRNSGTTALFPAVLAPGDGRSARADWKWLSAEGTARFDSHAGGAPDKSAQGATTSASGWRFLQPQARLIPFAPYVGFLALGGYLASLIFHSRRLWLAWRRTNEIRRSAEARSLPRAMALVAARCQAALGLADIPILFSSRIAGPITLGARCPMIILPNSLLQEESEEDLISVFAHEMAHIQRRDFLMNLVYELVSLPVSFHPAVALLKRRINETREMTCDDIASRRLTSPTHYARSLVALARRISAAPAFSRSGYTLGVFDADVLEERIMRLLNQRPLISPRLSKAMLAVGACFLAASCIFASAFSLGVSQESKTQSDDALKPFVGTWQAKLMGMPYVIVALKIADHKLAGKVISYRVILDDNGHPAEVSEAPAVCSVTHAKVEGENLTLSGDCPDGKAQQFAITLTGNRELEIRVVGIPPPPEESGGLKLTKEPEPTGEIPNSIRPFLGTWQATFAGHSFMTLTLSAAGDKLTGTMSPCRIALDANGKLTSAERGSEGGGWHIIDARLDGSKLSVKAKEDASADVDEFEMSLTSPNTAEFKPVGGPMAVEPWPMTRGDDEPGSHLAAPPQPPPPPRWASLGQDARPVLVGQGLKGLDFSGRWDLDKTKSSLPPSSPGDLTQRIEQSGSGLKISTASKDWQMGQPIALTLFALTIPELTITPDNTQSTQRFGPGELLTKSHWEDGRLVTDWKLKRDGAEVMAGQWTRSLSKDAKTLTLQVSATDSQSGGAGEAKLVFVKTGA